MKYRIFLTFICTGLFLTLIHSQETGLGTISVSDLRNYLEFMTSDELEGRGNVTPGLEKAARYLADQSQRIGLIATDENKDYIQDYSIYKNSYALEKSRISISDHGREAVTIDRDFYMIFPQRAENLNLSGEVIFAGYGIRSEENRYDDFKRVDIKDKIVLIMDRAPMSEDGSTCLFENFNCSKIQNFIYKYFQLFMLQPKAVLLVQDPKSGHQSIGDLDPSLPEIFSTYYTPDAQDITVTGSTGLDMKVLLIHRDIAEKILEGSGFDLAELQNKIDSELKPHSFPVKDKTISINLEINSEEKVLPNVAGLVKGSDPELSNDLLILMAHFDHMGKDNRGNIYRGANDNASGSAALLEIAEAFMQEDHKPRRSILFLWVSGEEIGLFGSRYYADHPLVPLSNTIAVINLDMVGRTSTPEDTGLVIGDTVDVLGPDTLGVIGGHKSKELLSIAESVASENNIVFDYSYNDINHPQKLYYRSDHFSFVEKDIPILFFSSGIHRDYHQYTDIPEKIDYQRLEQVSRYVYLLSYNLADRKERIIVDHPYSTW